MMPRLCSENRRVRLRAVTVAVAALAVAGCAGGQRRAQVREPVPQGQFSEQEIRTEAEGFFPRGARGLADVMNRVIADNGTPDAYIKGDEAGGAVGVGLRYGRGTLYLRDGRQMPIFWRGPSLGIDLGGSAARTFILIYNLPYVEALYERFGGVEGSLYFVGGVGVNYNRDDDVVLAPVRFGLGWRQGVSVGYLHLSPERSWLPF